MTREVKHKAMADEAPAIMAKLDAHKAMRESSRAEMASEMAYMNIYGQILDLVLISNKINKMIEEATESDCLYAENCVPVESLLSMLSHTKLALSVMKDRFPDECERSFSGGKVF